MKKRFAALFWIIAVATPLVSCLIAIAQLPAGTSIPMHWDAAGEIDRFGSAWEMLIPAAIMTLSNLAIAIMSIFSEKICSKNPQKQADPKQLRILLGVIAAFIALLFAGIMVYWIAKVEICLLNL